MKAVLLVLAGAVASWTVSPRKVERVEAVGGRQVNALLADGWKLYDPEGFQVDRFDE